jgi:hypothetical protein
MTPLHSPASSAQKQNTPVPKASAAPRKPVSMAPVRQLNPYSDVAPLDGPPDRYTMTVQSIGSITSCNTTRRCIWRPSRRSAAYSAVTAKATASVPSAVWMVNVSQATEALKLSSPSKPSSSDSSTSRAAVTQASRRASGAAAVSSSDAAASDAKLSRP